MTGSAAEVDWADFAARLPQSTAQLLARFRWDHLPPALRVISAPFGQLAAGIVTWCPPSAEQTVALRMLLEAKDAAVRAAMPPPDADAAAVTALLAMLGAGAPDEPPPAA